MDGMRIAAKLGETPSSAVVAGILLVSTVLFPQQILALEPYIMVALVAVSIEI